MRSFLNLPKYEFSIKRNTDGKEIIYDPNRKRFVVLTKEEWVRQNFICYLIEEKKYPRQLICIEKTISVNKQVRRCDAVVYNKKGEPLVIMEFKAPQINISQEVFDQIAGYNYNLKVDYLIVSNGIRHFCCKIDYLNQKHKFRDEIPNYQDIIINDKF